MTVLCMSCDFKTFFRFGFYSVFAHTGSNTVFTAIKTLIVERFSDPGAAIPALVLLIDGPDVVVKLLIGSRTLACGPVILPRKNGHTVRLFLGAVQNL